VREESRWVEEAKIIGAGHVLDPAVLEDATATHRYGQTLRRSIPPAEFIYHSTTPLPFSCFVSALSLLYRRLSFLHHRFLLLIIPCNWCRGPRHQLVINLGTASAVIPNFLASSIPC
jgi:hypothetical protein